MTDRTTHDLGTRERHQARSEERRRAEQRAARRRSIAVAVGGTVLIAVMVGFVVLLMGDDSGGGTGASSAGEVTVEGAPRDAPLEVGERIPTFVAPELSGGTVSWDDVAGSPAVLPVWASWCPHCQAELPVLDRVMEDYPDVAFLTVVTDVGGQPGPTPEQYMRDQGLEFPVAVDDADATLARGLGVTGFPTLYFVNSDGTVALQLGGEVDEQTLRTVIEALA